MLATSFRFYRKSMAREECTRGKTAKIAHDYLAKGKEIALEGKLTNRTYEDKQGNKHYFTEVLANQILILDKKSLFFLIPRKGAETQRKNFATWRLCVKTFLQFT